MNTRGISKHLRFLSAISEIFSLIILKISISRTDEMLRKILGDILEINLSKYSGSIYCKNSFQKFTYGKITEEFQDKTSEESRRIFKMRKPSDELREALLKGFWKKVLEKKSLEKI